jgi:hypothetical protein
VGRVLRTDENVNLYIKGFCSSVPLGMRLPKLKLDSCFGSVDGASL